MNENAEVEDTDWLTEEILQAIEHIEDFRKQGALFGKGNSTKQFLEIVHDKNIWEHGIQKVFIDRWG